jgi:hypothetical protein
MILNKVKGLKLNSDTVVTSVARSGVKNRLVRVGSTSLSTLTVGGGLIRLPLGGLRRYNLYLSDYTWRGGVAGIWYLIDRLATLLPRSATGRGGIYSSSKLFSGLPISHSLTTVLRSPHVNKVGREQFRIDQRRFYLSLNLFVGSHYSLLRFHRTLSLLLQRMEGQPYFLPDTRVECEEVRVYHYKGCRASSVL